MLKFYKLRTPVLRRRRHSQKAPAGLAFCIASNTFLHPPSGESAILWRYANLPGEAPRFCEIFAIPVCMSPRLRMTAVLPFSAHGRHCLALDKIGKVPISHVSGHCRKARKSKDSVHNYPTPQICPPAHGKWGVCAGAAPPMGQISSAGSRIFLCTFSLFHDILAFG